MTGTPFVKIDEPRHGQVKQFFAVCWDGNIKAWVMVPCSRADLLRQVVLP